LFHDPIKQRKGDDEAHAATYDALPNGNFQ
jgi:hypothetical protein